jgi:hypothetical protein
MNVKLTSAIPRNPLMPWNHLSSLKFDLLSFHDEVLHSLTCSIPKIQIGFSDTNFIVCLPARVYQWTSDILIATLWQHPHFLQLLDRLTWGWIPWRNRHFFRLQYQHMKGILKRADHEKIIWTIDFQPQQELFNYFFMKASRQHSVTTHSFRSGI